MASSLACACGQPYAELCMDKMSLVEVLGLVAVALLLKALGRPARCSVEFRNGMKPQGQTHLRSCSLMAVAKVPSIDTKRERNNLSVKLRSKPPFSCGFAYVNACFLLKAWSTPRFLSSWLAV